MEPEIRYTVKTKAKLSIEKPRDPRTSTLLSFFKWVIAIFLSLLVLSCVVASKISLLSVGAYYNVTRAPHTKKSDGKSALKETTFIMMVLILMIPQFLTLLRAVWVSLIRKSHPWPSNASIYWCLLAGFCEVVGITYFLIVIVLYSSLTAAHCILVMNGLFLIPIIWQIYKMRSRAASQCGVFVTLLLSLLLEVAGIGVLTFHVIDKENLIIFAGIPASLALVSFAWCAKVQKLQIKVRKENNQKFNNELLGSMPSTAGPNGPITAPPDPDVSTNREFGYEQTARGKSAVISGLWKLLLTPFIAALFCYLFKVADLSNLRKGFLEMDTHHPAFPHFMAQICTSFLGYILGWLTCSMCIQRIAFALPLTLATPISIAIIYVPSICRTDAVPFKCDHGPDLYEYIVPLALCLWVAQFLSTGFYVWKEQTFIMAKESSLFWLPSYNGAFLEQNLLLNRKNQITDEFQVNQREIAKKSCVYICTTMYHETENEMEQLLNSLHDVDTARQASKRQFEAHIFFDGAVNGDVLNDFVLQLIALIPKTLRVKIENCMKIKTPYGMQLRWRLPGEMPFHIHLKDNLKVKNKKRWSQAMYMSYVLDFKEITMDANDDNTYILATDADVRFTHESVQALLDFMMRDEAVGAVCGRTHPLGYGPIVWYQVFDYAIGHWFQKVANHVLGSVLCSPGCFSVYRASAIRDVLPIYASGVNTSVDFLTKDMGEDRWLCTLMVQSGWRLEYCAAAEDSTFCPESFDEFFKQRRRWIPSTLANLIQLIGDWRVTVYNNQHISIFFILYQALMVFSTLISPSTVILVIAGALSYVDIGIDNEVVPLVLLTLITIGFALVCLYTKQDFQLKVAKFLTIVFALIMAFVTVGMAAQIATDLDKRAELRAKAHHHGSAAINHTTPIPTTAGPTEIDLDLPADVSTLYLAGLVGIFMVAAMMHLTEAFCLVHGIWYLFCLPSGYLLLIIYSLCNMTDRSWGTREAKEKRTGDEVPWYVEIWNKLKVLFWCCLPKEEPSTQGHAKTNEEQTRSGEEMSSDSPTSEDDPSGEENRPGSITPDQVADDDSDKESFPPPQKIPLADPPVKSALKSKLRRSASSDESEEKPSKWRFPGEKKVVRFDTKFPKLYAEQSVEEWLPSDLRALYTHLFKENGYDNVSFIVGMTNKELRSMGISKRGHRMQLVLLIERIPHIPLETDVPDSVEEWLHELGLESYWTYFSSNGYTEPRILEDLKAMDNETLRNTMKEDLQIVKVAHVNKMIKAIKNLQYPTPGQREIRHAREVLKDVSLSLLETVNQDEGHEYRFWKGLREACLLPESAIFGAVTELKEKLEDLRDSALMVFAIANAIWMIFIVTLNKQAHLKILGTNAFGFAFLAIYGLILVIQFLTLIWHRISTICHMIARAPWKRGPYQMAWSFKDADLPPEPTQADLERIRHPTRHRRRRKTSHSRYSNLSSQPLLDGESSVDYSSAASIHSIQPTNQIDA